VAANITVHSCGGSRGIDRVPFLASAPPKNLESARLRIVLRRVNVLWYRQDAFAGKPRSYWTAAFLVGARLAREESTSVPS
jgi:hypothetical protein